MVPLSTFMNRRHYCFVQLALAPSQIYAALPDLGRHGHGYATHSIHDDNEDDVETPAADATERLTAQMQTMSLQVNGALIEREHSYKPAMHISVLPPEVILKIGMYSARWPSHCLLHA